MKKRLLSLALSLCLSLGLAAPTPALALAYGEEYTGYDSAATQQYRDVPESHWAAQSIATCSQRTWFNGYPDGTFRPEGLITREEAAKVFAVAMGLEIQEDPEVTYTDTADNWARAYIEATKPLFPDATNLQGTASFRPTQTITREETIYALVVAWRYASKATNADLSVLNMFSDTNSISVGVKPYMAVAVSEGLVSGLPDGTIAAQKGLTRAEFATLLARALSHGYGDTKQEFQAPKLTLDRYDATTVEETLFVTGKVTPAENVTVALDGDDLAVSSDGSFSVALELDIGDNSFTLTAENAYGATDSKTIQVTRQEEKVTIRLLSTVPEETKQETVEINGKVENWSDSCVLLLDNSRVSVDSDGYFQTTLQLEEGRNTFTLTVTKGQKEVGTTTVQITRTIEESTTEPSADPAEGSAAETVEEAPERETIDRGMCGKNLSWVLYDDGELYISGTGEMDDFDIFANQSGQGEMPPWFEVKDQIKSVVLAEGVTRIGGEAFFGCAISEVSLPDSLESIDGGWTFENCPHLTSITIPRNLDYLATGSFGSGLKDVYYPGTQEEWDSLVTRSAHAFGYNFSGYDPWGFADPTIHYNSTGD